MNSLSDSIYDFAILCRLSYIINHLNTEQNFTFFHIVWHIGAELVSSAGVENTTPFKVDIEK